MIFIYFKAPFGAFRIHQSIETSITSDFLTHSAAYGFILGLAGIGRERKNDFKNVRIAVGIIGEKLPKHESVYQQLHLAVGKAADYERTKGIKPSIRPIVRELLIGLQGCIALDHTELEQLVSKGINNPESLHCWGIPFLGDNNFFLENIRVQKESPSCRWFYPFNDKSQQSSETESLHYLSTWTDFDNNAQSSSRMFALSSSNSILKEEDNAWIRIFPTI